MALPEEKAVTVTCEIAFAAPEKPPPSRAAAELRQGFAALPGLVWLDLYAPASGPAHDPYVQDVPPPAHLAMLAFGSVQTLAQAASTPAFATGLAGLNATSCTAMRCLHSPIAGEASAAPLRARFSYVVRYHRPAARRGVRPAVFERSSAADRPAAGRPQRGHLRSPALAPSGGPPPADYLLGNEATFDDAGAFNAAMASPARTTCARITVRCRASPGGRLLLGRKPTAPFRVSARRRPRGSGHVAPKPGLVADRP